MVVRGHGGLKDVLARGFTSILRAPVFLLVSALLVAYSVFTTLQVRKAVGWGLEEGWRSSKLSQCI